MNIAGLKIDNFGVWSGLELTELSGELIVLYGPNETGKTTLLEFIRGMFYGFESARRDRYLPAMNGGPGGGGLLLESNRRRYQVLRRDNPLGAASGALTLLDSEGESHHAHVLHAMLSDIDETTYRNVFAVGLDEIQQLRTLSDGEASKLLYDLSLGLDRVSLVEVIRELKQSRRNILADDTTTPAKIAQLISARNTVLAEIAQLDGQSNRFWQISSQREALTREVAGAETDVTKIQQRLRLLETANSVRVRWQDRVAVEAKLAEMGVIPELPEDGTAKLDGLVAQFDKLHRRWRMSRRKHKELRKSIQTLTINETLWRQSARVEALAEHEPWVLSLETQIKDCETEISRINDQIADQSNRIGFGLNGRTSAAVHASEHWMAPLKSAAAAVRHTRKRVQEIQNEASTARESTDALRSKIETNLHQRSEPDLSGAVQKSAQLVTKLRRRVQVDERLEQLERNRLELQEAIQDSLDQQVLPVWQLAMIGLLFVLGIVLMTSGMVNFISPRFMPGNYGPLFFFGMLSTSIAVLAKWGLEKAAVDQFFADQKQMGILRSQILKTQEERDALDQQLPKGGGHLITRLQNAEKELLDLEELVPVSVQVRTVERHSHVEKKHLDEAIRNYKGARRRWRQALVAAGLPESLTPVQFRELAAHGDIVGELQRKLDLKKQEFDTHNKEYHGFRSRVSALYSAAGIVPDNDTLTAQMRYLRKICGEQEALFKKRNEMRRESRQLFKDIRKCRKMLAEVMRRRRMLIESVGAEDEDDFRRRVELWAQHDDYQHRYEALQADIIASVGDIPLKEIEAILHELDAKAHEQAVKAARKKLETAQKKLRSLFERRGDLRAQLKAIAEDRRLSEKQLELSCIKKQIDDAVERWQVLGLTELTLEEIKVKYETQRQPEALRKASEYLMRMTDGRYRRVWTPLDVHELKVEDQEGNSLPVEILSRGTREQLFLSLRLAIISSYLKRGVSLPLILDDVLVNFDVERAAAAAQLLQEFAAAGHQLFVFTCHEHIFNIFRNLKVDCRPLRSGALPLGLLEAPVSPPKKKKKKKPEPVVIVEPVKVIEPEPEPEIELVPEPVAEIEVIEEPTELEIVEEPLPPVAPPKINLSRPTPAPMKLQIPVKPPVARRARPKAVPPRPAPVQHQRVKPKRVKRVLMAWSHNWDAEEFAGELADRVDPEWHATQRYEDRFYPSRDEEVYATDEDYVA